MSSPIPKHANLQPGSGRNQNQHRSNLTKLYFIQSSVLEHLPFQNEDFDFMRQHLLVAAIPTSRWSEVIRKHMRVTKRGRRIKLVKCDIEGVNLGPPTQQFFVWCV